MSWIDVVVIAVLLVCAALAVRAILRRRRVSAAAVAAGGNPVCCGCPQAAACASRTSRAVEASCDSDPFAYDFLTCLDREVTA